MTDYSNNSTGWLVDISNSPAYNSYLEAQNNDIVSATDKRNITTIIRNRRTFINTFTRNANLACFRYDIKGLPETISKRAVKQGHLWFPGVAYFELDDAPGSTFALPAVPGGSGFNMQGDIADAYAFGMNGDVFHIRIDMPGAEEAKQLTKTPGPYKITAEGHGVFVRENYTMWPFINQVIFYSDQIADTMRAMENNRYWLKHPVGLHGTEEERKTWERQQQNISDNQPYTWLYDTKLRVNSEKSHMEPSNMNDATDFTRPCSEVIDWFEQQFWRECGIQNMGGQIDKKGENLQTAEVTHTDDYTSLITQELLETFKEQINMIHKLPGCENVEYTKFERGEDNAADISGIPDKKPGLIPGNAPSADDDNGRG